MTILVRLLADLRGEAPPATAGRAATPAEDDSVAPAEATPSTRAGRPSIDTAFFAAWYAARPSGPCAAAHSSSLVRSPTYSYSGTA